MEEDIVIEVYQAVLFRSPTATELADNVAALQAGTLTRDGLTESLIDGAEYAGGVAALALHYESLLDRSPDLDGITFWLGRVIAGGTVPNVAAGFANSDEAAAQGIDPAEGATSFVTDLYQEVLGRAPDATGLAFWEGVFAASGEGAVTAGIVLSAENRAQAEGFTKGYAALRAAGENEPSTAQLQAIPNSATTAEIIAAANAVGDTGAIPDFTGVADGLPALPANGGPAEVLVGTGSPDNIDGDQDGVTISGSAGGDRFIFNDVTTSQDVTIDDFTGDDQIRVEGGFAAGDLNIINGDGSDGIVVIQVNATTITLTNIDAAVDPTIFSAASFISAFGDNALSFDADDGFPGGMGDGGGDDPDPPPSGMLADLPGAGGPAEVTAGTAAADNIDADQDGAQVAGGEGLDRFIFDNITTSQTVELTDFSLNEQLRLEGGFSEGDVNVINSSGTDGLIQLTINATTINITGVSAAVDPTVFSTASFTSAFGADALAFG